MIATDLPPSTSQKAHYAKVLRDGNFLTSEPQSYRVLYGFVNLQPKPC
jgi:hypothetical protein